MLFGRSVTKIEEMLKEKTLGFFLAITGCAGASGQSSLCPSPLPLPQSPCCPAQHTVGTICERVVLQTQFSVWGQLQSSCQ